MFAFFGAGWFARQQLAAWHEIPGVRCAAGGKLLGEVTRDKLGSIA
jgi:hypothetical protein